MRTADQVKTGRTHLMDAVPMRMAREFGAWRSQVLDCAARLRSTDPRLLRIAFTSTAVS